MTKTSDSLQAVTGIPSNYTLDLNSSLTQVLADGTNTYLYGLERIGEQQPGGWQYHLGDALGSVRQLADNAGNVVLAKSYQPYGEVLSSSGTGASSYGFTGETSDTTGLTSAQASGGTGGIYGPETYAYDAATGNLASKAGVSLECAAQCAS